MRAADSVCPLVLAMLLAAGSAAMASTNTGPLASTVAVVANCHINTTNMNFANYDPLAGTAVAATSIIAVACTKGTTGASIALDNGQNSGNATNGQHRAMKTTAGASSFYLSYDLFQDAGHGIFWGNTPGTNTKSVPPPSSAAAQNFTAFGQIPANLNAHVGTYN